jgi:site-specific DNA recombinase
LCGDVTSSASGDGRDNAIELTAAVASKRRGAETKLVLPELAQQKHHHSRCNPALIKAIARGRSWFEELGTARARSLQELARHDGITRRYIRRLVGLAYLSPQLVEATLQGRQPVELTTTRLTELDLPLDWTQQHKPLASSSQTRRSAHWRRERSELKPAKAPVFNNPTVQRR